MFLQLVFALFIQVRYERVASRLMLLMSRFTNIFLLILFIAFLLLVSYHERFLFNSYNSNYFVVAGTELSPEIPGPVQLSPDWQSYSPDL